jgi:uncharacterized peroxidase-related enzyme
MSYFTSLSGARGIIDVFKENLKKYMPSLTLAEEFLREPSALSSQDRETIAMFTSYLNKCEFCYGSHREFAISLGVSLEDIQSIIENSYSNHRLARVLDYVKKLTLNPSSLTKLDFDAVISSGISEEELKDAIAVCSVFNYFNRIVEGHFIQKNEDTWKSSAERINLHGYDNRR